MSHGRPAALDVSGTAQVPLTRLVKVELRKSYDTRAGFWLLVAIGGLVALVLGIFTAIIAVQAEPVRLEDFVLVAAFMIAILLPILAIMLVTTEWTQRSGLVTFSLEPRRERVVLAKLLAAVVLGLATMLAALLIGLACTLVCELANPDLTEWELSGRYLAGFTIAGLLAMLGGFAIATLLLNTPAAIVLFFVYRFILPIAFGIGSELSEGFRSFALWVDFQGAQEDVYDLSVSGAEAWGQLLVSGFVWLVLPLGLGLWRIHRAEVK